MSNKDLIISVLLEELETVIRKIIRDEIKAVLLEANIPFPELSNAAKTKISETKDDNNFPQLLTAPQAAELLGVKTARVYELTRERNKNSFPVIILGERSYRYSKESLLNWINR